MIDRYTRPEMGHIFSLENKYAIWQEIEVLACEAQAELGKIGISKDEAQWIRDHANFEKAKVDEIEEVTRHDVIAFLTNMKEYIDADVPEGEPKPSRWVHYGMTSSDLGDTALCYQLTQACDLIIEDVKKLGEICKRRAFEERNTLCAGRTHGIHAEPMTFGMKFGSWAWELKRDLDRLEDARKNVAFGAISGAVGTYSSIEPFVEEYVCEHLGLVHDPLSTQVISRDHHAYLAGVLATTAATCERIATEVRNLQKTDTLEAEEPFRKGQKGSSAMPHKRNPITMEKVCGLSRIVKSNAQVAFDNVALWHERDISHSSAERVAQAVQPPAWFVSETQQRVVLFLNHIVMQEPQAMERLVRQTGRIALVQWRQFSMALVVTPAGLFNLAAEGAQPDLRLQVTDTNPLTMAQAALRGDKPAIRIEGDVQLAADINWLVENLSWDVEEDLARVIGDVPAHTLANLALAAANGIRQFVGKAAGQSSQAAGNGQRLA